LRNLLKIFLSAFATGFSGAVTPGPLLVACAHQTLSAGFAAGMTTVAGHAAMELVLVGAMLAGLARLLKSRPAVFHIVKALAGASLLVLGAAMIAMAPSAELSIAGPSAQTAIAWPFLIGAAVSIGNPYFILWWATIGLGLLGRAARSGHVAVSFFYVGHILSDFAWFAFVVGSLALGRNVILRATTYRILLAGSGVFMVAFGLYFALARGPKPSPPQ